MSSLVLKLQEELLNPDCDVLGALRKAHLIAAKLKLTEFDAWIQSELNGYSLTDRDNIPNYRDVKGALNTYNPYYGWVPVQCKDDETEKLICERRLWQSVGELQNLYQQASGDSFLFQFPAGQAAAISSICNSHELAQFSLSISAHLLKSIIEQVKNCLLEWTIRLEENGILGENMTFSKNETTSAKSIPQQINHYHGPVINGAVSNAQIVSGDNNTIAYNADAVANAISEIKESLAKENISTEDMSNALDLLEDVSNKVKQGKKPSIIKATLVGLGDFVLSVGANITASLITAKLQGLF